MQEQKNISLLDSHFVAVNMDAENALLVEIIRIYRPFTPQFSMVEPEYSLLVPRLKHFAKLDLD